MHHIEFIHTDYFRKYHFVKEPDKILSSFIEYYWETDFDDLWKAYPDGFSDIIFPNTGYTYLINLGTSFLIKFDNKNFEMKIDCFLPRNLLTECRHKPGNKIFGIKFRISPLIFEKRVNFSEYNNNMYSLSYLIDHNVLSDLKKASSFETRVEIMNKYYGGIVKQHADELHYVNMVSKMLTEITSGNKSQSKVSEFAKSYKVDVRTLQRYFARATGISPKKAIQLTRIRKVLKKICEDPESLNFSEYGYYDYSHFYKELKKFMMTDNAAISKMYLNLLEKISKRGVHTSG